MGVKAYGLISMDDKALKRLQKEQMAKKEIVKAKPVYFTSGHTLLDMVVGAGEHAGFGMGYPAGVIARDHGDNSSSKSYKATELIAANYHKYKDKFKWRYCDVEHGNTFDTVALYGFDLFGEQEDYGRDVITVQDWDWDLNKWLDSLKPDECGIYVLDSLDALTDVDTVARKEGRRTAYDKDKEFNEGSYMLTLQKFLSQEFFRGLTAKLEAKNAMLYVISQERANISNFAFAPKTRTSNDGSLKFMETVRLVSKMKTKEERKGRAVSTVIEVKAEKVRNPRPWRSCFVTIHFTYGMDSMSDEIDFLYDLRTDGGDLKESKKAPIKVDWDGNEMSREELIEYIPANGLRKELKKRVIAKWDDIEDSIAIKRPAKFAEDD